MKRPEPKIDQAAVKALVKTAVDAQARAYGAHRERQKAVHDLFCLVGGEKAAELLGISRQRVYQLADKFEAAS